MSSLKVSAQSYLFREGDAPDAMYVVKTGKLAIVKTKANSEIVLAEVGPGAMVGEMAFFDQQARSASVKALKDSEVIPLPFKALHQQFQNFPEWAKAIMKQVSKNLRSANARIKQLEKGTAEENEFPHHTLNRLLAILCFVAERYGTVEPTAPQESSATSSLLKSSKSKDLLVPAGLLRNTTIQVFQESTYKMQTLLKALDQLKLMSVEDLGEGKQRILCRDLDSLFELMEWLNEWLFKKESEKFSLSPHEVRLLHACGQVAVGVEPNGKGQISLCLNEVSELIKTYTQKDVRMEEYEVLIGRGFLGEKILKDGRVFTTCQKDDLLRGSRCWHLFTELQDRLSVIQTEKNSN